jgi:hypothetical protein
MIRINLLAEELAAEEMRRRDPAKRGMYAAGALVGLVMVWAMLMQSKVMSSNSQLQQVQSEWDSLEKKDKLAKTNLLTAALVENKLDAIARLSTNRFLWTAPLNALQFCMVDGIEVLQVVGSQTYSNKSISVDPVTSKALPKPKVTSVTETATMTIRCNDLAADSEANHIKFMNLLAFTNAYFRDNLRRPDPVTLEGTRIRAEGTKPATFMIKCYFLPKQR